MPVVPLRVSNRLGFGKLEVQSVTTSGTVTTFNFNDHPQRRIAFDGGFWVKLPATNALTQTNTIEFATLGLVGSNIPVYVFGGRQATVADINTTSGGVVECYYDASNNRLQLIGLITA